ncbi:unnamed protein product [Closterium sp. NIES-53]
MSGKQNLTIKVFYSQDCSAWQCISLGVKEPHTYPFPPLPPQFSSPSTTLFSPLFPPTPSGSGVVSMADVAMHLVREGARPAALKVGVVSLIGNSPEGLSLWVASSSTPLRKHQQQKVEQKQQTQQEEQQQRQEEKQEQRKQQMLLGRQQEQNQKQPLAPKHSYHFVSQTDVAAFLLLHVDGQGHVAQRTVEKLGLTDPLFPPLAIVSGITVTDALRLMQRAGGVRVVAVVAGSAEEEERMEEGEGSGAAAGAGDVAGGGRGGGGSGRERGEAGWVRGGRLLGTLLVSDLRGMDAETLAQLTSMKVRDDPTKLLCAEQMGMDAETLAQLTSMEVRDASHTCAAQGVGWCCIFLLGEKQDGDVQSRGAQNHFLGPASPLLSLAPHTTHSPRSLLLPNSPPLQVRDFLAHMASLSPEGRRSSITYRMAAPLAEVIALAATNRVHRVWVTGEDDELLGVFSLTDVISACRRAGGQR